MGTYRCFDFSSKLSLTRGQRYSSFAILQVKPNEIILLAAGSYKEGTKAFLASDIPQIVEDMENGMSADEAVPHYARPMDLVEMISEFMGSGFEPRYG